MHTLMNTVMAVSYTHLDVYKRQGCHRVRTDELFLLNPAPDSLDGRYFGALPAAGLIGTAHPILTRDAPDQPLRWRGFGASAASPTTNQEHRP